MNKKTISDFTAEFWDFIPAYHRFMHRYYNQHPELSLNKNQMKTLMIIYHHGKTYMSKMGECIGLQKGSLTTLIDSLEKKGYIKREEESKDRRKTILALTPKADELIKARKQAMRTYISRIFKDISNSEIEELINSFRKITKIMKKLYTKETHEKFRQIR